MAIEKFSESMITKAIPGQMNDSEILFFLHNKEVNWKHIVAIKDSSEFSDEVISSWLNLSVKTLREYRKPQSVLKGNVKEQVLLLLTLIKHGVGVFGSRKLFDRWLDTENFFFDKKRPESFLNTVTGIKFVNDRLTAMEYGDNV